MSFLFDGSNQTLTHDLITGIGAWPITILVKFKDAEGTSTENDRCIVDFTDTTGVFPFFRAGRNDSDQKLRLAVRHSNNAPATARSTGTYSADVWNTGAWEVVDANNGFSRLNGSSRGPNLSGSIPGSFAANGPFERISIGYERNSSTDPWDGKLAEIAIYTSILTDAQHTAFHNGDKPDTIDAGNLEMYLSLETDSLTDSINSYVFTAEGTVDPVFDNDHPSMNGSGDETLVIDSGSYSLTGTDIPFKAEFNIIPEAGSYNLSGTSIPLTANLNLVPDSGSYSLAGTDIDLRFGSILVIEPGSYTLTGTPANFSLSARMTIEPGSYILSGTDLSLLDSNSVWTDIPLVSTSWTDDPGNPTVWTNKPLQITNWTDM